MTDEIEGGYKSPEVAKAAETFDEGRVTEIPGYTSPQDREVRNPYSQEGAHTEANAIKSLSETMAKNRQRFGIGQGEVTSKGYDEVAEEIDKIGQRNNLAKETMIRNLSDGVAFRESFSPEDYQRMTELMSERFQKFGQTLIGPQLKLLSQELNDSAEAARLATEALDAVEKGREDILSSLLSDQQLLAIAENNYPVFEEFVLATVDESVDIALANIRVQAAVNNNPVIRKIDKFNRRNVVGYGVKPLDSLPRIG